MTLKCKPAPQRLPPVRCSDLVRRMGRHSHKAIERILKIGSMTHDEAIRFMQAEKKPALRWKPMDVAYGDNIRKPRRLVLEVNPEYPHHCYTTCSENDGIGSQSDYSLRTKEEWLAWVDRFSDDLTGKELREAKEAVCADFVEPQSWTDFRKRYAETRDPWIRETNTPNAEVSDGGPLTHDKPAAQSRRSLH